MTPSVPVLEAIAQPLTLMGASWKATVTNIGFHVVVLLFFRQCLVTSDLFCCVASLRHLFYVSGLSFYGSDDGEI